MNDLVDALREARILDFAECAKAMVQDGDFAAAEAYWDMLAAEVARRSPEAKWQIHMVTKSNLAEGVDSAAQEA